MIHFREKPPTEAPPVRFSFLPPGNVHFGNLLLASPELSPNGSAIVFLGSDNNLWLRHFINPEAHVIPGTQGASYPFWSPDSRSLAFFTDSDNKLKKISVEGGPPVTICNAASGRGGAWGRDGTILFAPSAVSGIYRVPAAGGEPVAVTMPDGSLADRLHHYPVFLPNNHHFL